MHLEGPHRRDEHGCIGTETRGPALDVEELLGPHVGPKACLGADDLVRRESKAVGEDAVVAVGDVAEGPAMDEGGAALERLQQVWLDCIAQEDGHRPGNLQVVGRDRLAGSSQGEDDPTQPGPQVAQIARQGQDRHDLRGDSDLPLVFPWHAVLAAAETDDGLPQGTVADVDHPRPGNRVGVDVERVLVEEAVVEER